MFGDRVQLGFFILWFRKELEDENDDDIFQEAADEGLEDFDRNKTQQVRRQEAAMTLPEVEKTQVKESKAHIIAQVDYSKQKGKPKVCETE